MLRAVCIALVGIVVVAASCSSEPSATQGDGEAGAPGGGTLGGEAGAARGPSGAPATGARSSGDGQGGVPSTGGAGPHAGVGGEAEPIGGAAEQGGESGEAGESGEGGGAGEAGLGGGPGAAGAGGGGPDCGQLIVNAGCADADPITQDYQSGEFQGCAHFASATDGWVKYDGYGGFAYDSDTGLGWVLRTDSGTLTRSEVAEFCEAFAFAGSTGWRLPTIDEARVFMAGCAATQAGGSCPLSDPGCLDQSCGIGPDCVSCQAHQGPYGVSQDYCPTDAPFCVSIATSSDCADCATTGDWRNGPINGNFYVGTGKVFPVCVAADIQRAVPCPPP